MATLNYEWKVNSFPASPDDVTPQIDASGNIYTYDASKEVWKKRNDLVFKRLLSLPLRENNVVVQNFFNSPKIGGLTAQLWNTVFPLTFVALLDDTGAVISRRAHVNATTLSSWLAGILQDNGNGFTARNYMLDIYTVEDPSMKNAGVSFWNAFYGSMRGRGSYFGNKRVGTEPQLTSAAGITQNFKDYHHASDIVNIISNYFYGQNAPADDSRIIWFGRTHKSGMYHQPYEYKAYFTNDGIGGRKSWNRSSSTIVDAPGGNDWLEQKMAVLYRAAIGTNSQQVSIDDPTHILQGAASLLGDDKNGREAVIVYNIEYTSGFTTHAAFVVKPYGITDIAFNFPENITVSSHSVIVRASYNEYFNSIPYRRVGADYRPFNNGIRVSHLSIIVKDLIDGTIPPSAKNLSIDSQAIPSQLHFYIFDNNTGISSPILNGFVSIRRRLNKMPLVLLPGK